MNERASVIIPTFNRSALLALTLARLVKEEGLGEIIVVDDGSSDDTEAVAAAFAATHPVRYFFQEDQGFRAGQARNLGIVNAANDILVFLDDDCVPEAGTVRAHLEFHRRRHRTIGIGRRVRTTIDRSGRHSEALVPDDRDAEFARGVNGAASPWRLLHSCHFSFRYSDFPIQFDPNFRGWGMEDCELGYRLWELGGSFEVVPDATVTHRDDPAQRDPFQHQRSGSTPDYHSYLRNCIRLLDLHPTSVSVGQFIAGELAWYGRDASGRWVRDTQPNDIAPLLAHFRAELSAIPVEAPPPARRLTPSGSKPALLFITPVTPKPDGVGIEQRAAAAVAALARRFEVHLVVVPVFEVGLPPRPTAPPGVRRAMTVRLDECRDTQATLISRVADPKLRRSMQLGHGLPLHAFYANAATTARIMNWCGASDFAAVHVHRLYLSGLVHAFRQIPQERRPLLVLDLDDDDAESHRRMAAVAQAAGDAEEAETLLAEAGKYERLAARQLPMFDRVTVCSEYDRDRLSARYPDVAFAVAPNSYRPATVDRRNDDEALRLLFVGALSYSPNADAVEMIAQAIVPALRRLWSGPIVVDVIGANPTARALAAASGVNEMILHGWVDDLAPAYARADVAVVPIRAGGGTRIKILEAFARGVPVVSTRIGAEGLDVRHGRDLLIADDAGAIAAACVRLKREPALAGRLARAGLETVEALYSPARLGEIFDEIYAPVLSDRATG